MKMLPFKKLSQLGKKALGYTDEAAEVVNEVPSTILRKAPRVPNNAIDAEIVEDVVSNVQQDPIQKLLGFSDPKKQNAFMNYLKNHGGKTALGAAGIGAAAYGLSGNETEEVLNETPITPAGEPAKPELPKEQPVLSQEEQEADRILNRLQNFKMPQAKTIDFDVGQAYDYSQDIDAIKKARDMGRMQSNVDFLARAVLGGKQSDDVRKMFAQPGEDALADFKLKLAMEEKDPNSQISKGFRELAKSMGINLKGDFTAEMGKEILPSIYKQQASDLERQFRAADREMQLVNAQISQANRKSDKLEATTTKRQDDHIKNANKLLLKAYETYEKVNTAAESTLDAVESIKKNPKMAGVYDVQLLYNFIKQMDPESVVREGEISLSESALSVLGKISAGVKNITGGDLLDNNFRNGLVEIATKMQKHAKKKYERIRQPMYNRAEALGVGKDRFIEFDPLAADEYLKELQKKEAENMQKLSPTNKKVVKKGYNAKTNKTQFIYSDGSKEIVDGRK